MSKSWINGTFLEILCNSCFAFELSLFRTVIVTNKLTPTRNATKNLKPCFGYSYSCNCHLYSFPDFSITVLDSYLDPLGDTTLEASDCYVAYDDCFAYCGSVGYSYDVDWDPDVSYPGVRISNIN